MAIPFGMSVSGCKKALAVDYCNAGDSGPIVGQVASITLAPTLATTGESLSFGQIGQSLSASAFDCKNNSVSVTRYTYATTNMALADINPSTGSVCAGTWNRNSGGGIADYTTCTTPSPLPTLPNNGTPTAYVTASAGGAVSNSIPIFIHPTVTSIQLGNASINCATDPTTTCCPASTTVYNPVPAVYGQNSCISQGSTAQLVARVYANNTNITCQVGHLTFSSPTTPNVVTIDENGVATANQPGSTLISASVANSSSAASAGFFSTCPPASITLAIPGSTATSTSVNLNNVQPLTATVTDTKGVVLTGVSLEFESTTPQTAPGGSNSITPVFPGTAAITAVCQPPTCNSAPFSQIGYLGNGQPLQSNSIAISTPGTSTTVLYMASTQSQYILPMDFSTGLQSSQVKLPYVPNSMVISLDGSTLYLGSPQGLMTVATANNAVSGPNLNLPGTVLSVSPNGATVVITDSTRQTISLYAPTSGSLSSVNGGVGTSAVWSPDSQTVYITTTTGSLLTHSTLTNWQTTPTSETYTNGAVMVPSIGAYFSGGKAGSTSGTTNGHSYCAAGNQSPAGTPPTITNTFAPLADTDAAITDVVAATNVGQHILGAHSGPAGVSTFSDIQFTYSLNPTNGISPAACPNPGVGTSSQVSFTSTPTTLPLTGITTSAITGVFPTSGQVTPPISLPLPNPTNQAIINGLTNEVTFVTYTVPAGPPAPPSPAKLPEYLLPYSGAAGTLTYVPLAGTATAPISGVWSTDNNTFYTGTSGDNEVHEITQSCATTTSGPCTWSDTGQLTPNLPSATGSGTVPVNLIAQKPKRVTS